MLKTDLKKLNFPQHIAFETKEAYHILVQHYILCTIKYDIRRVPAYRRTNNKPNQIEWSELCGKLAECADTGDIEIQEMLKKFYKSFYLSRLYTDVVMHRWKSSLIILVTKELKISENAQKLLILKTNCLFK